MNGKLSIVGTPIGNLEDIALRALRTLRECDAVICEDTRITKGLLFHFEITGKSMYAYDEHSHNSVTPKIVTALTQGKHLALVSDAGMPAISDPGSYLVHTIRTKMPEVTIEVIGGPTALTNALAWTGFDTTSGFWFAGFIPHKKGRETLFKLIISRLSESPIVAYESSHRIEKTVSWFAENAPTTTITLAREITKLHEEIMTGTPTEIIAHLQLPHKSKGEFVIIFTI